MFANRFPKKLEQKGVCTYFFDFHDSPYVTCIYIWYKGMLISLRTCNSPSTSILCVCLKANLFQFIFSLVSGGVGLRVLMKSWPADSSYSPSLFHSPLFLNENSSYKEKWKIAATTTQKYQNKQETFLCHRNGRLRYFLLLRFFFFFHQSDSWKGCMFC